MGLQVYYRRKQLADEDTIIYNSLHLFASVGMFLVFASVVFVSMSLIYGGTVYVSASVDFWCVFVSTMQVLF